MYQYMEYLSWLLVFWEEGNWVVCYVKQLHKWLLKLWFWTHLRTAPRVRFLIIVWWEALMIVLRFANSQKGYILWVWWHFEFTFLLFRNDICMFLVDRCDVLTVEIEHVDVETMEMLEQLGVDCQPKASTIRIIQVCFNLSLQIWEIWIHFFYTHTLWVLNQQPLKEVPVELLLIGGIISLCTKLCPFEEIPILVDFGATVDTHPSLNFVILKWISYCTY